MVLDDRSIVMVATAALDFEGSPRTRRSPARDGTSSGRSPGAVYQHSDEIPSQQDRLAPLAHKAFLGRPAGRDTVKKIIHPYYYRRSARSHWLRDWDFLPRLSGLGQGCAPSESSSGVRAFCVSVSHNAPPSLMR